jgi:hypothetical protein
MTDVLRATPAPGSARQTAEDGLYVIRVVDSIDERIAIRETANVLLAFCNMRTLYLRNVPEEVVERLERLAARDATSVGAVAVRELADVSRRADNPALLGDLPDRDIDAAAIVADVADGRAER